MTQVARNDRADRTRPLAGADQRDALRAKQLFEIADRHRSGTELGSGTGLGGRSGLARADVDPPPRRGIDRDQTTARRHRCRHLPGFPPPGFSATGIFLDTGDGSPGLTTHALAMRCPRALGDTAVIAYPRPLFAISAVPGHKADITYTLFTYRCVNKSNFKNFCRKSPPLPARPPHPPPRIQ